MLRSLLRSSAPILGVSAAIFVSSSASTAAETRVLAWGGNSFGECGLGLESNSVATPHEIEALRGKKIIAVSTSGSGTNNLALSEDGTVFSWGCGASSRLGHGTSSSNQLTPRCVEGLPAGQIKAIAMGEFFGLALDKNGVVFSFGTRATGHDNPKGKGVPAPIVFPSGVKIEAVFAGREHAIAIDEQGGAWTFGVGSSYSLAHGDKKDQLTPRKIAAFEGKRVLHAAAGREHSLFLVEDGGSGKAASVYSVGTESFGQCGHGGATPYVKTPTKVSLGSATCSPVAVFAGEYSSFVLCEDHAVYAFGRNKEGALGLGSADDVLTPRLLDTAAAGLKGKVVDLAAGGGHTLFLTEEGNNLASLFAAGRGRSGQLGRGDGLESSAAYRTSPVAVRHIGDHGVPFAIAAGRDHSLAVVQQMA